MKLLNHYIKFAYCVGQRRRLSALDIQQASVITDCVMCMNINVFVLDVVIVLCRPCAYAAIVIISGWLRIRLNRTYSCEIGYSKLPSSRRPRAVTIGGHCRDGNRHLESVGFETG